MGRDKHHRHHRERLPPFVPLFVNTLDSPAWRALSHGARSVYVALKRRVGSNNNGNVYLSQRDAQKQIGSHHNEIARWFRELQHYGFVVVTALGSLGVDGKGKAPHWRLTELPCMGEPATRNFERWDGSKFVDQKTDSRAGKGARGVPEKALGRVRKWRTPQDESVREMAHIQSAEGVREKAHITSIPLPSPLSSCSVTPATLLGKLAPNAR